MKKNATVSVVVPCYNQHSYLEEAVNSVINQTYKDWECLIINDGSVDNTEAVALNLVQQYSKVKYFKKENGGLADARNYGIARATGKYILPLDADDTIAPEYIHLAVAAMEKDPLVKVVYCEVELFGAENRIWTKPHFSLEELAKVNMIVCTALYAKDSWNEVGGYDTNMVYGWEDWEFWISLLKDGGNVVKLDYTGFYYRVKEGSMLRSMDEQKVRVLEAYLCTKHWCFFQQFLGNPLYLYRMWKPYRDVLDALKNRNVVQVLRSFKRLLSR